jgi:hypothetical protein
MDKLPAGGSSGAPVLRGVAIDKVAPPRGRMCPECANDTTLDTKTEESLHDVVKDGPQVGGGAL